MTREVFVTGLEYLKKNNPQNSMIGIIDDMGYTPVSVVYLTNELNTLDIPVYKEELNTDVLDPWYKKLNAFYVQRAKLSNKFHDANTDEERADISSEIKFVQNQCKQIMLTIDYYKANGTLPDMDKSEFEIPDNDIELMRKAEHIRQSISRAKRNLKERISKGLDTSRAEKSLEKLKQHELIIKGVIQAKTI